MPRAFDAANNKSFMDNLPVCKDIIADMASMGVIQWQELKPTCVNPLGLVTRVVNGETKHRLVFDGSRWVNNHVTLPHVKLAHVEKVLESLHRNDYMATFDLKSAYYQIMIHKDSRPFLGAAIQEEDGIKYSLTLACHLASIQQSI